MNQFKLHKIPYHLIIIFFILAVGIGVAGYLYYQNQMINNEDFCVNLCFSKFTVNKFDKPLCV